MFRPVPRRLSRALSILFVLAWFAQMGLLVRRAYLQDAAHLAADLSQYGSTASWRGIYYRGEKIGFSVGQITPVEDGFEIKEDGRLQMILLGATTAVRLSTVARVDRSFALRSFSFGLDPGTGATQVNGRVDGRRLELEIATPSGRRTDVRELAEPPALSLNLSRRLAAGGLVTGARHAFSVFDPATLTNAPLLVDVLGRDVVRAAGRPIPAFKVRMTFGTLVSTSWIDDVGEVVREESPLGLVVVKESPERATALAVPGQVMTDILEASAVVPVPARRIENPNAVELLRVRLTGVDTSGSDLQGAGQTVTGDVFEVVDARTLRPGPRDPEAALFLHPEPFLESDAPEIVAEAALVVEASRVAGVRPGPRAHAERLVRHVNDIIEKKPTVSLPSALEVLRTRVGDCNEHTALYVALARALGIPARIAVGLVHLHGAFYYHAWPEVYLAEEDGGLWLPVDPTLNQFPADATHIRLARGGLDRQAALLPVIGRTRMDVLELRLAEGSAPVLVGRAAQDTRPLGMPSLPRRETGPGSCWRSSRGRR
ncbi:MAG TPA: transglutaminase-like domain-containing protein [Vicinamibacteria bacterium]|nr:transglutaminase-like domain-containing protein [Vicinamibacteria bacterium]